MWLWSGLAQSCHPVQSQPTSFLNTDSTLLHTQASRSFAWQTCPAAALVINTFDNLQVIACLNTQPWLCCCATADKVIEWSAWR